MLCCPEVTLEPLSLPAPSAGFKVENAGESVGSVEQAFISVSVPGMEVPVAVGTCDGWEQGGCENGSDTARWVPLVGPAWCVRAPRGCVRQERSSDQ